MFIDIKVSPDGKHDWFYLAKQIAS